MSDIEKCSLSSFDLQRNISAIFY